jgi:hypothetical protein
VLELGEDEGGAGYLGDAAGAGGDVLQDGSALGEQGEPALSLAAQAARQRVPGASADVVHRPGLGGAYPQRRL